jgi:hypothetical protein
VPSDLKAGTYIVSDELLALHFAIRCSPDKPGSLNNGPESYPVCINIKVIGNGTTVTPAVGTFPGLYNRNDPGILTSIYYGPNKYVRISFNFAAKANGAALAIPRTSSLARQTGPAHRSRSCCTRHWIPRRPRSKEAVHCCCQERRESPGKPSRQLQPGLPRRRRGALRCWSRCTAQRTVEQRHSRSIGFVSQGWLDRWPTEGKEPLS